MRLLTACPACRRQYDAEGKEPGDAFACSCGATVAVRAPRREAAAVVRCSSCGGTRQEGEPACRWCGSEFTLRERDLNTICPQCATRISDRARHCHACGVAVEPQPIGAGDPRRPCPVCDGGPPLASRGVSADLNVLECARCGGLWIAPGPLRDLVARVALGKSEASALLGPLAGERRAPRERPDPGGPLYRACVVCAQRMNRTRFAGRTPVVVDYCRTHGVWFDDHELAAALEALIDVRTPQDAATGDVLPGDGARARALNRPPRPPPRSPSGLGDVFSDWDDRGFAVSTGIDVLGAILRFFH